MSKTLADISEAMKAIDFCMLVSRAEDGSIGGRPMSNNGEVDYDGDSYYFTWDNARMVADIRRNPRVGLAFQGKSGLLGMRPFMLAVEGEAQLIYDRELYDMHWTSDLDRYFTDGPDTDGIVMIRVRATRIHYWDGEDDGEIALA